MDHGPGASGDDTLSSLLSMLNSKEPGSSITSVVNATTMDLLCNLLYPEDYVSIATQLSETSDVANLLDFMLHLIRNRLLSSPDASIDFNRRARRLLFKMISTNPVIPQSLIVTDVKVPAKRGYIGSGGFGGVFKGELRGEIVALKVLRMHDNNVAFRREALMWAMLKHDFVLPFLGIYEQQEEMFLLSPYMKNSTLAHWRKNEKPSVNETWDRILEVAQGMEYIHSEGIVHGDLRGENVLLDANLHVQIADFGLTRLLDATNTQSGAKHLNFSAPELFGCLEDADDPSAVEPARTQMSDVYAFGCLYYEIYYDSIPFAGRTEAQVTALIIRDKRPDRLEEPPLSDEAWEVNQRCWAKDGWKRPRMKDVVESLIAMLISQSMLPPRSPGDGDALSSLLSILKNKKPRSSITSVINTTIIDLLCNMLYPEDYISVATRLSEISDVLNLLDFILYLLRNRLLSSPDASIDFNRRARRLLFRMISTNPVIPRSLIITEVKVLVEPGYIQDSGFGRVFKGELRGEIVALKALYPTGDNVAFCREALMWATLKHEFVLSFLGIYKQQEQMFFVSPYTENGTLAQWRKNAKPSVNETWDRILEVAQGMEYIHSEGIVHGDLRGDNVLLDGNLHVQIADFGLTQLLDAADNQSGAKHINFAAPELFGLLEDANDHLAVEPARTQMSDVYAFGCLCYEIHYDSIPFAGRLDVQIMVLVIHGKRPRRLVEPPLSDKAWEVNWQCWATEPQKRPRMKDVVESLIAITHSMPLLRFPVASTSGTTSTSYNPPRILDSTLLSLLSLLNDRKPRSSIASVVNVTTVDLVWKLLSREDYANVAGDLSQALDAKNLLDFMLHLLRDHRLLNQDPTGVNIDQRARRFMIKVISKIPVIPQSLIVTGVDIPVKRDYIGMGRFGYVFRGKLQGAVVVLKVLHDVAFCREALTWQFLKHKFVLPFLGIHKRKLDGLAPQLFLVSPYMRNGTLRHWRQRTNPSIAEIEKRILQVAQGLEYIHSEGLVHGDINGANVLLDDNFHVQIVGFGLTRLSAATNTGSGALRINFAAPELFELLEDDDTLDDVIPLRTQMSDVYAFGCLYYQIHYDTMPFAGRRELQIMRLVSRGVLPPRQDQPPLSDEAWDIIQHCWTREPSERPRMKDVVESLICLILNRY
ncbi:kinase-like domain-containing protein [Amanita rubescens]|nr:kinase-like domain-containing protein [Amanita rubescens]